MSGQEIPEGTQLSIKEIMKILPHRYPFLLIDRVVELDLEKGHILAQKNLSINEAFFQGHFPGAPIMPGVLILEALAQAGAVLVYLKGQSDKIAVLMKVDNAKFRNPAKPGDILLLKCEGLHISNKGGKIKATATVNGKIAVEVVISFALVDKSQI